MHQVTIICFGKLKESYWREACEEYAKRLSAFCKLEVAELPPVPLPDEPSPAQIAQALAQEAARASAKIPRGATVVALCVEGKQITSQEFSRFITSEGKTALLVGSSFGLDESLKRRAQACVSLSKMTFPHQLARVLLLEQLYRGFQIAAGGKYHK
ncbi:MAG: 23S rRNA (pseudouridine(1915)-N(3))-methyltransferase RlmH [Oscillospiraceae bacterium]|nr:23S rRNA (pseudouridine(1915)-N(3))-methyltransferase RlmH [Oscillospiraceae bacterium]